MEAKCKLNGRPITWPCSAMACQLFGDCISEWKAEFTKPRTNADRIRAMSDEELAKFIPNWSYTNACKCGEHYVDCNNECKKCVAEWLRQPAEKGE